MNEINQTSRDTQVRQKLMALDASIEQWGKIIEEISIRLQPILLPGPKNLLRDVPQVKEPEELCGLAQELQDKIRRLEAIRNDLDNMMRRIEL